MALEKAGSICQGQDPFQIPYLWKGQHKAGYIDSFL